MEDFETQVELAFRLQEKRKRDGLQHCRETAARASPITRRHGNSCCHRLEVIDVTPKWRRGASKSLIMNLTLSIVSLQLRSSIVREHEHCTMGHPSQSTCLSTSESTSRRPMACNVLRYNIKSVGEWQVSHSVQVATFRLAMLNLS